MVETRSTSKDSRASETPGPKVENKMDTSSDGSKNEETPVVTTSMETGGASGSQTYGRSTEEMVNLFKQFLEVMKTQDSDSHSEGGTDEPVLRSIGAVAKGATSGVQAVKAKEHNTTAAFESNDSEGGVYYKCGMSKAKDVMDIDKKSEGKFSGLPGSTPTWRDFFFDLQNRTMAADLWGFMSGEWRFPEAGTEEDKREFARRNNLAYAYLFNELDYALHLPLREYNTNRESAREAIAYLKTTFEATDMQTKADLQNKLSTLRLKPGERNSQYIGRALTLRAGLRAVDPKAVEDSYMMNQLLNGLPDEEPRWENFRNGIQYVENLTLQKLLENFDKEQKKWDSKQERLKLQEEERRRLARAFPVNTVLPNGEQKQPLYIKVCAYCKEQGHMWRFCQQVPQGWRPRARDWEVVNAKVRALGGTPYTPPHLQTSQNQTPSQQTPPPQQQLQRQHQQRGGLEGARDPFPRQEGQVPPHRTVAPVPPARSQQQGSGGPATTRAYTATVHETVKAFAHGPTNLAGRNNTGWVLDSGASLHMTGNMDYILDPRDLPVPLGVEVGNGKVVYAQAWGAMDLLTTEGTIRINCVLYVPEITVNLLSMSRLMEHLDFSTVDGEMLLHDKKDAILVATASVRNFLLEMNATAMEQRREGTKVTTLRQTTAADLRYWPYTQYKGTQEQGPLQLQQVVAYTMRDGVGESCQCVAQHV